MKRMHAKRNEYNVDFTKYTFLDLGSKNGGSIEYCENRFHPAKGLGIDIKESVVANAKAAGFDSIQADATKFDVDYKFEFISMLDFLEHLPNLEVAEEILENLKKLTKDFFFIRHPSFDDIEYLAEKGLKFTWHDWDDHTNMMRITDYTKVFDKLGLKQYCFNFRKGVMDSSDDKIVPLNAPVNTLKYDESLGPKPDIKFPRPLYGQIDIFVAMRPIDFKKWNQITQDDWKQR